MGVVVWEANADGASAFGAPASSPVQRGVVYGDSGLLNLRAARGSAVWRGVFAPGLRVLAKRFCSDLHYAQLAGGDVD